MYLIYQEHIMFLMPSYCFGIYRLSLPIHSYEGDKLRVLLTKSKRCYMAWLLQDPPEVIEYNCEGTSKMSKSHTKSTRVTIL